jgi:hypothetical protein
MPCENMGLIENILSFGKKPSEPGLFDMHFVQNLTELRMIRNREVHSSSLDRKQVEYAVQLADDVLKKLKEIV